MQLDLIQCTVTLNEKGATNMTTVVKAGPDAITPAEAFILMNLHPPAGGTDSVHETTLRDILVIGTVERDKNEEMARLREKYGAARVQALLPSGMRIPQKISDIDIPVEAFAKPKKTGPVKIDRKQQMDIATKLFEAGVMIPDGATDEDIARLATENGIKVKETA